MKLLIDMNLSPRWVNFLTQHGFEAIHWISVGAADAPDIDIMSYAAQYEFIVFTHDLDFSAILAVTQAEKPSVIQLRGDSLRPEDLIGIVVESLMRGREALEAGALLTIDAKRMRLRILPLAST